MISLDFIGVTEVTKKYNYTRKTGRPEALPLTAETLKTMRQLGMINCTTREVAAYLNCTEATLFQAWDRHPILKEAFEDGKMNGRSGLRRKQIEVAMKGNPSMLIWLGKNLLDQKEQARVENFDIDFVRMCENATDAQLVVIEDLIKQYVEKK